MSKYLWNIIVFTVEVPEKVAPLSIEGSYLSRTLSYIVWFYFDN